MGETAKGTRRLMDSWWDLAEWTGHSGQKLRISSIKCPHCLYEGSFETVFNVERVNQSLHKKMHFLVLKCNECLMYCFVMWSPSRIGGAHGIHGYVVFPRSLKTEPTAPRHWPVQVGSAWEQAHKCIRAASWDAAATMAGRALEAATRHLGAKPGKLVAELNELGDKGILPKSMVDWAHEIRVLRNVGAHPDPVETRVEKGDASDVAKFLDCFLTYVYDLPKEIADYKERRVKKK